MWRGLGRKSASPYGALGPLAFVRSGLVNLLYGQSRFVGQDGYGWSRTSGATAFSYRLVFLATELNMQISDRYHGFPLRCLYPGGA